MNIIRLFLLVYCVFLVFPLTAKESGEAKLDSISFDFQQKKQFEVWQVGPKDAKKAGTYEYGELPVNWQYSKGKIRGNGGYLMLPVRLSTQHPINIKFIAGEDNGNIHAGLFTQEPVFMAINGGYYFNAGGCSNDFTSLARDGEWFAEKELPFETGFYPIEISYEPNLKKGVAKIVYAVNNKVHFTETQPMPKNAKHFTFAFLSGWTGGGYSVNQVKIKGKILESADRYTSATTDI